MGPCVGHVNAAMPTRSGPPRPFVFLFFLAATEKPEPPRNGIKNRALLCFEVPVASGGFAAKKIPGGLLWLLIFVSKASKCLVRVHPTKRNADGN